MAKKPSQDPGKPKKGAEKATPQEEAPLSSAPESKESDPKAQQPEPKKLKTAKGDAQASGEPDKEAGKNPFFLKVWWDSFMALIKGNPKTSKIVGFSLIGALVLLMLINVILGLLPKPAYVSYSLVTPRATNYEENQVYPFILRLQSSAAPLDRVGLPPETLPVIRPDIPGQWNWDSDRILSFTPREAWEIGQHYQISMDRTIFAEHVLLEDYDFSFQAEQFDLRFAQTEFYIDPFNTDIKRITSTIRGNYPMDLESLREKLSIVPGSGTRNSGQFRSQNYDFTLSLSEDGREAYLVSEPMGMPLKNMEMKILLDSGAVSLYGGQAANETTSVTVPGVSTFARINSLEHSLVLDEDQRYQQIFTIQTTGKVTSQEIMENIEFWALPDDRPQLPGIAAQEDYVWRDLEEILPEVLELSTKLELEALPTLEEYADVLSFRFTSPIDKSLYVKIQEGTDFFGGYYLAEDYEKLFFTKEFPRELDILSDGALLSRSGSRRLNILSRGIPRVQYNIGRVRIDDINHLVTQSDGHLDSMSFGGSSYGSEAYSGNRSSLTFNEYNITEQYTGFQNTGASPDPRDLSYFSLDLNPYLGQDPAKNMSHGLFYITVRGLDDYRSFQARRFVLVTDLGLITKTNIDGTREIYVQSLSSGNPVPNAIVEVWGRNGNTLVSTTTRFDGHIQIPSLSSFRNEQEPTAIVVRQGQDLVFMPMRDYRRRLDYSSFEVGGVRDANQADKLQALLFSDRGIYRPGNTVNLGIIIKAGDWTMDVQGTPTLLTITDPRNKEVYSQPMNLSPSGFEEAQFITQPYFPTGEYRANLYLVKPRNRLEFLGSETFQVEEFLPDTLKIESFFQPSKTKGWISPEDINAVIRVKNLFGTPAAGNVVQMNLSLTPGYQRFSDYPNYRFTDPLLESRVYNENLGEQITNDQGEVEQRVDLSRFDLGTYRVRIQAQAFEKDSGRSVTGESTVLVSPLEYITGYKVDGGLRYINRGIDRQVEFIALNSDLQKVATGPLKLVLEENRYISILVKQPNGLYKYQSVQKTFPMIDREVRISPEGLVVPLPTDTAGEYRLTLKDSTGRELNAFTYSVVGEENVQRSLVKDAKLELQLDKEDYRPGETIEVFIKGPYQGSGLITIEKDRVYAQKWFEADGVSSVQTIRIPAELEGNAYVNVALVRSNQSREIFMSPLSYGVLPFSISKEARTNPITINIPELAKPGLDFPITYSTAEPAKMIVFAVDEGILQVADYEAPDPLGFFMQKRALEVRTDQILDLLMPENSILATLAAIGGGEFDADTLMDANLNPFRRKEKEPVAFWSGLLEADARPRTVNYPVPDHFNGTLRVFAVAVSQGKLGVEEQTATIRSPYVIQINSPTFLAPGDAVDVSLTVTNLEEGSGPAASQSISIETSEHFEILEGPRGTLNLAEGEEETFSLRLKALKRLGAAEIAVTVRGQKENITTRSYLSVRPITPYRTILRSGRLRNEEVELSDQRDLMEELAKKEISASTQPLSLANGLLFYLENYPYGCSEQITSQTFPYLFTNLMTELEQDPQAIRNKIQSTIATLQARQKDDGSFGLYTVRSRSNRWVDVYIMDFLTVAKAKGHYVPDQLFDKGMENLEMIAASPYRNTYDFHSQAYAIYVLTKNEVITTSFLERIRREMDRENVRWQSSQISLFLAGSYKLLQMNNQANNMLAGIRWDDFWQDDYFMNRGLAFNGIYLYIHAKYFPDKPQLIPTDSVAQMEQLIRGGGYNTFSTAMALMGWEAYLELTEDLGSDDIDVYQIIDEEREPLPLSGQRLLIGEVDLRVNDLVIKSDNDFPYFYQYLSAGYDQEVIPHKNEFFEIFLQVQDESGSRIKEARLGETVEVEIRYRGLGGQSRNNVAFVVLMPSGLEADIASLRDAVDRSENQFDYVDIREDRIIFYGSFWDRYQEFSFKAKAINQGDFVLPPVFGEDMYDHETFFLGEKDRFTVLAP
jgi:uncharacterized protein YfaS (alpha-2-macroglobulin family)